MKKRTLRDPIIKYGWLRALIYCVIFLAGLIILRTFFVTGLNIPFVALSICLLVFLVTFLFRKLIDRKSFVSLGFSLSGYIPEALAGAMLSVFIVGASCLILKATELLKWTDIIFDPKSLFITFGTFVLVAVYEELIFRGYLLSNLLDSVPRWPAILISAALFMIYHWSSAGFFPVINSLLMGLIMGLNYSYTRNLWFSIFFHTGWKFFEGPVLGLPDFGFPYTGSTQSLLQTAISGNENATGGANGLEGSYILLILSLLSLLAMYLFLQKKLSPRSQPVPGRI